MSKMPIRKPKRVTVLTKRMQCLKKPYRERSYRPLYEKVKINNNYLAKALSEEKQNNQSLFSQNVELIAEIQQLNLMCNTRNTIISNVLNNTKQIVKMLVPVTDYVTKTILICEEFFASNSVLSTSAGKNCSSGKESPNTLSTKSPAKGVVKPMVGGHTITKPTINLSRVNIESINNISRLSDIQEVTMSNRSQEMNETRSSIISLPTTPLRYENTCRLPERLTISSPRISNELRRKKKNHSNKLSVSFLQSRNRWSDTINISTSPEQINTIGTNIDLEAQENTSNVLSNRLNVIPDSQELPNSNEDETHARKDSDMQLNNKSNKDISKNLSVPKNSKVSQINNRTWEEEDPLEGPSWLFNNTVPSRDNETEEIDHNVSDVNNNTSQITYDDSNVTENNIEEISSLNESVSDIQTSERAPNIDRSESESYIHEQDVDNSIYEMSAVSNREKNLDNVEDNNANDTTKFTNFVTMRRGNSEAPEEIDDEFTLMLRQSTQNMQFNINELRLPVLQETATNNSVANEIETSAAIPRVSNIPLASMSNRSLNESDYNHITIKLPLILINDHMITSPQKTKHSNKSSKKPSTNRTSNNSKIKNTTKSKKSKSNRDPSTAKVVLEKLNESHVKPRTSATNNNQNANNLTRDITSDEEEHSKNGENSTYNSNRPRRRKAPVNLKEPDLHKKLRRD